MEIQVIEQKKKLSEKLRVCAYCRVSTEEEEQENSLENQITHYEESIQANPGYGLVGIYHDFGISGFKEDRPGFQEMLQAARNHEFVKALYLPYPFPCLSEEQGQRCKNGCG